MEDEEEYLIVSYFNPIKNIEEEQEYSAVLYGDSDSDSEAKLIKDNGIGIGIDLNLKIKEKREIVEEITGKVTEELKREVKEGEIYRIELLGQDIEKASSIENFGKEKGKREVDIDEGKEEEEENRKDEKTKTKTKTNRKRDENKCICPHCPVHTSSSHPNHALVGISLFSRFQQLDLPKNVFRKETKFETLQRMLNMAIRTGKKFPFIKQTHDDLLH